jgi:MFS family permease
VLTALATAVVVLPAFVARSARHRSPALDLELFRSRPFSLATAITVLFSAAFFAVLLANVLFLTGVWGYSELRAGLGITPSPLLAAALSGPAGAYADRHGHRAIVALGSALVAAATIWFAVRVGPSPDYLTAWLPGALLLGAGVGLAVSTVGAAAVATLPPARFGAGSAVGATARQLGGIAGVSALIAVLGTAGSTAGALTAHRQAWVMVAGSALLAAVGALGLPRGRPGAAGVDAGPRPEPAA